MGGGGRRDDICACGEGLDGASVELRSGLKVEEPMGFVDVDGVVAGVRVRASVLTEEGGTVMDV